MAEIGGEVSQPVQKPDVQSDEVSLTPDSKSSGGILSRLLRKKATLVGVGGALAFLGGASPAVAKDVQQPQPVVSSVDQQEGMQGVAAQAAEVQNQEKELLTLFNLEVSPENQTLLNYASKFILESDGLRGQERHIALEGFNDFFAQKYQELKSAGASAQSLDDVAKIWLGGYHDYNSLVAAGSIEDIIKSAEKAGMVSKDGEQKVREALNSGNQNWTVDLDNLSVSIVGKDGSAKVYKFTEKSILTQLIGSAELRTPLLGNQGTETTGLYDMKTTDPETYARYLRNPEITKSIVDNEWDAVSERLKELGVEVSEENAPAIKEALSNGLAKGDIELKLPSDEQRSISLEDFSLIGLSADIQHLFDKIFEMQKTEIKFVTVGQEPEIIGGKISKDMLCKGNKVTIITPKFSITVTPSEFSQFPFEIFMTLIADGEIHSSQAEKAMWMDYLGKPEGVITETPRYHGKSSEPIPGKHREAYHPGGQVMQGGESTFGENMGRSHSRRNTNLGGVNRHTGKQSKGHSR